MVTPVGSSSKSFFTPSSQSTLGNAYLGSASGDRISLSGKRSSENEALGKAVTTLKVTERALGQLVDIADKMLTLTADALDLNTTDLRRGSLNRKFDALVEEFRGVLTRTKQQDGVDLTDRDAFNEILSKAGLVEGIGGTLGALIGVLGGKDKKLDTEDITIEGFKFQDAGTTRRFQQTFAMLLSNMTGIKVSDDAKKGGSEVTGTTLVESGSASVLFGSSANYQLNNPSHYQGIAEGGTAAAVPQVTYNAAPPSADLTILDADTSGRYALTFMDDGSEEKIRFYDRQTDTVVRDLLTLSGSGDAQAAISGDANKVVFYEDTGSATELKFSDNQGSSVSTLTVTGGIIDGRVAASDTVAVFASNATSLGADGSSIDLFITDGYSSPTTTRINISALETGAILNKDSVSISNDGSTIAFSVNTPGQDGKLYLYNVAAGVASSAGLSDVQHTSLDSDGSRIALGSNAGGAAAVTVHNVSFTPAGSTVYTLSSEQPSGQIGYGTVIGTSSTQAIFQSTTDYLSQNAANKTILAEAANLSGVASITFAPEQNMRVHSVDDSGQYGIVSMGRWIGDNDPYFTPLTYYWDFVNNAPGTFISISATGLAEVSADGQHWVSSEGEGDVHWGDSSNDYNISAATVSSYTAASNNNFVVASPDSMFGGDGSRWDIFISDGYSQTPTFTQVQAGGGADVAHTDGYHNFAVSDDGNVVAFVNGTSGSLFLYNVGSAQTYDTGLTIDPLTNGTFSLALNGDGSRLAIAQEAFGSVEIFDTSDPQNAALAAGVTLDGDTLDASRVFINSAGDGISFAADLGAGRIEVFNAVVDLGADPSADVSYEGQPHTLFTNLMTVSLETTQGVVSTAADTYFSGTGSNMIVTSRADYLSSNPDRREAAWRINGGVASELATYAGEAERPDLSLSGLSSDGTWAVGQFSDSGVNTLQFYEVSTGRAGTQFSLSSITAAISPDGTKGAYVPLAALIYLSSDVQNNEAAASLSTGEMVSKISTADDSVAFVAKTDLHGGGNVYKELFYTSGGDGYSTHTTVERVALANADISSTAFSFSQDGSSIFFADATASKNFYSYSTGTTITTDTGLDGVSSVVANADGTRAAVVRTIGANQYVQILDMTDAAAPTVLASQDVTGAAISSLSLNAAGEFAGYVVNGATDVFNTLQFTPASTSLGAEQGQAALGTQTAPEVSLSADGSQVAYTAGFTGSTSEVFMSTIDGTTDKSYYFKAGQVQRSYLPGEDETDVPVPDADEPLNQSLTTRGRATLAGLTIKKLRDALEKDKERIAGILEVLGGKTVAQLSDPEAVAQRVLEGIAESGKFHKLDPSVVVDLLKD